MTIEDVHTCRICGSEAYAETVVAHEMMYGNRRPYTYFQCADCGCLQIAAVPRAPSEGYPPGYYSFKPPAKFADPWLKARLKRLRAIGTLRPRHPFGALVALFYRPPEYLGWLSACGARLSSRILDVGCGSGELLVRLACDGFEHLTGIDPYLPEDIVYPNGIGLARQSLNEAQGIYDIVMCHHSFEHMADPQQALANVCRLLAPGGWAMIRIPVADSQAWQTYREHWVQLDAPRHLYLHTRRSMALLADAVGFALKSVVCDSTAFQFWGSEQYRLGIPLTDPRSAAVNPRTKLFSRAQMQRWDRQATRLNRKARGDQAVFFLKRPSNETISAVAPEEAPSFCR